MNRAAYVWDWEKAPDGFNANIIRRAGNGTLVASVMHNGVHWTWSFRLRHSADSQLHVGHAKSLETAKTMCDNALRRRGVKLLSKKIMTFK